jgi:Plasmid encoded RepA protein
MGDDTLAVSDTARFERHVRLLAEVGMSPELTVRQLLIAGFPVDWIRARFPTVASSTFEVPVESALRRRRNAKPTLETSIAATKRGSNPIEQGALAIRSAGPLAERVARQAAAASSGALPAASVPTHPRSPATVRPELVNTDLSDGISFQYVPLIQCSFPHMDPGDITHFTRRNGWLELTLSTARPDTGLPYGVPARLLTMYCASEAIRTHSPEIHLGATLHEFLGRLDVPITRGERGSLRVYANQLLRLMHCAISVDENIRDAGGRTGLHIRQALFVEEARLWWDGTTGVGRGSSLVLSPALYDSILERSAPLSTRAIRQLRKSPMDLDVYAWLVHRLYQLSRPSSVTWGQLSGQFGHSYTLLRKFRAYFAESLKRVQVAYPEAKLKLTGAGITLLPSRPHVPRDALTQG